MRCTSMTGIESAVVDSLELTVNDFPFESLITLGPTEVEVVVAMAINWTGLDLTCGCTLSVDKQQKNCGGLRIDLSC